MRYLFFQPLLLVLLGFGSNVEASMNDSVKFSKISEVPESIWLKLANKKIYFGHQSVGQDLLQGINELMDANPVIKLSILKTKSASDFGKPVFAHSYIGENEKPESKNREFSSIFGTELKDKVDIAFFKYCFVDINKNTDLNKLFEDYKRTITNVKNNNSNLIVLHLTVPLTTIQSGIKAWVKGLIGREVGRVDDNVARNKFNQMIINEYAGTDYIFDLARFESTKQDATREQFKVNGAKYYSMVPLYTYDGGHLNDVGKKYVAEQFLLFLVNDINL